MQAKVQGLEDEVQCLQHQLTALEIEKARNAAELKTLTEYVNSAGAFARAKQPAEPSQVVQLHRQDCVQARARKCQAKDSQRNDFSTQHAVCTAFLQRSYECLQRLTMRSWRTA